MSIFNRIRIKREPDVFAECECCGQPIWKANDVMDGEHYVELSEDYYVHVECIPQWVRENEKEAK